MSARQKLNRAFLNGILLLAAILGAAAQSWLVFTIALALLLIASVITGEIRMNRRR